MSDIKEPKIGDDNYYEYWISNTKRWIKEIENQPLGTSDSDYIYVQKLKGQLEKLIKDQSLESDENIS